MAKPKKQQIPSYFLYGDVASDVELDFLHVEPIRDRSGPNDWIIRAHAHPDHVQILLVEHGGGEIGIEGRPFAIAAPALAVIPMAMVHEIRFRPDTDGFVITAAGNYVASVVQNDTRYSEALARPAVYAVAGDDPNAEGLGGAFRSLCREYVWTAPGRRAAIMAHFQRVLVALLRLRAAAGAGEALNANRDYDILSRYRELLEQHFRSERGLDFYASRLSISPQRLNLACKARAGKTASEILHERIVIEAKRCLIYMELTVAEVGYDLGFDDPAYFSRFFSQRVGQPPGAYREMLQRERRRA